MAARSVHDNVVRELRCPRAEPTLDATHSLGYPAGKQGGPLACFRSGHRTDDFIRGIRPSRSAERSLAANECARARRIELDAGVFKRRLTTAAAPPFCRL